MCPMGQGLHEGTTLKEKPLGFLLGALNFIYF